LTGANLVTVAKETKLSSLGLDGTSVGDELISELASSDSLKLESLSLMHTEVTRASRHDLATMTSLRKLTVWGSNMTVEDRETLSQRIPACEIYIGP
jgi:hypothetical protein